MSNYQDQYSTGAAQTDEYGNPIHHGTTGTHTGGRTTGYDSAPTQQSAGGYGTGHESGYGAGTGGHGTGHESGYGAGTGGYGTGGGAGHDAYGTGGGVGHDAYGTGTGTGLGTTHQTGGHGTGGQYGTTTGTGGTYDSTTATGRHGQPHHRRSGSGSSSSSEDDGQGGRRKKGLKEKIKEKLPGGHKDQYQEQGGQYTTGTTPASGGAYYDQSTGTGQQPEKRGFIDKIKDKLPGSH